MHEHKLNIGIHLVVQNLFFQTGYNDRLYWTLNFVTTASLADLDYDGRSEGWEEAITSASFVLQSSRESGLNLVHVRIWLEFGII